MRAEAEAREGDTIEYIPARSQKRIDRLVADYGGVEETWKLYRFDQGINPETGERD